jgi:hypothetical protein
MDIDVTRVDLSQRRHSSLLEKFNGLVGCFALVGATGSVVDLALNPSLVITPIPLTPNATKPVQVCAARLGQIPQSVIVEPSRNPIANAIALRRPVPSAAYLCKLNF